MGRKSKNQKWREALSASKTKLTPEVVRQLKEAFSIGATVKQACYYAEIAESTYYDWILKNPKLGEEFTKMRQRLPLAAKTNIASAIQNMKDIGLSKWLVERTEPDAYGETLNLKHQGDLNLASEDKEALESFHETLRANLRERSLKKAKEEGELPS